MPAKINNEPLVSIVTTSYNYARLISGAIDSVIAQDYSNWELVVADDGSSDDSIEIINNYIALDNRIRLVTHPDNENRGLAATMKIGIENTHGDIIAFLESDDIWMPGNLSEKAKALNSGQATAAVFSSIELIGDNISKKYVDYIRYLEWAGKKLNNIAGNQTGFLLLRNPAATFSNIVFRREALKEASYDREFEKWLDWHFLLKASAYGKIKYIHNQLVCWRIHDKSLHYQHIDKSSPDELALQKRKFIEYHRQSIAGEYKNQSGLWFDLEFAIKHPGITLRKLFNLYEY